MEALSCSSYSLATADTTTFGDVSLLLASRFSKTEGKDTNFGGGILLFGERDSGYELATDATSNVRGTKNGFPAHEQTCSTHTLTLDKPQLHPMQNVQLNPIRTRSGFEAS